MRRLGVFLAVSSMLFLAACKVELHSDIAESEVNEMVAVLTANGVSARKGAVDKGLSSLDVESSQLARAVEILRENGYPREEFNNLGNMFQEQGLISSPLEERVRFVYGLSQTISETLSQIDGVITARVHIVLPEPSTIGEQTNPPSAAVFLKSRPGTNLEDTIPNVKDLVRASVEGLSYDNVVVTLFEADPPVGVILDAPIYNEIWGIRYDVEGETRLMIVVGAVAAVGLLLLGIIVVLLMRRPARPGTSVEAATAGR